MHLLTGLVSILLASTALARSSSRFPKRNTTTGYELKKPPLDTEWTKKVGTNPWPEYPRPLLQRTDWTSLNGVWQWQNATKDSINDPPVGVDLQKSALVPFCLESALSGIMGKYLIWSWYRTTFKVPSSWAPNNRVLLNFGAVDYEATVFVNGKNVTKHTGGYWEFTVDVTDFLIKNGTNELLVHVYDPTDMDNVQIPIGKQTLEPSHIFYTPCSGIWQSVWLESAPAKHITKLHVSADMHGKVDLDIETSDHSGGQVQVTLFNPHKINSRAAVRSTAAKATAEGKADTTFSFTIDSPELWSPDSPTLYNMTVKLGDDIVQSYVGFRTISRGVVVEGDNEVQRPFLNGEFVFQFGTLDQGFWPDGIYTAPSREAMIYDLQVLKRIGYNMVRKHIKVEPALFYQACDQLGLLVFQDMPSLRTRVRNPSSTKPLTCEDWVSVGDPSATEEFSRQLQLMIQQLKSYPSIVTWIIYNEGWGQPPAEPQSRVSKEQRGVEEKQLTEVVRKLDPTRLINTVSGWFDHGAGDYHDNHKYANPQCGTPFYSKEATPYDPKRIGIQGEFGGIGHNVSLEHLWNVKKAIDEIDQTYEIDLDIPTWNYRAHIILSELLSQVERFACSAAVWTQTTDVEGEVNGMLTYDRRILRPDLQQWNADIKALYDAGAKRRGNNSTMLMAREETVGAL